MLDILIVDPNKVCARMIKGILEDQLKEVKVDMATNKWELKRRLEGKQYGVILADLSMSMDGDEMEQQLHKSKGSTVIVWSTLDKAETLFRSIKKPSNRMEFKDTLACLIEGR